MKMIVSLGKLPKLNIKEVKIRRFDDAEWLTQIWVGAWWIVVTWLVSISLIVIWRCEFNIYNLTYYDRINCDLTRYNWTLSANCDLSSL